MIPRAEYRGEQYAVEVVRTVADWWLSEHMEEALETALSWIEGVDPEVVAGWLTARYEVQRSGMVIAGGGVPGTAFNYVEEKPKYRNTCAALAAELRAAHPEILAHAWADVDGDRTARFCVKAAADTWNGTGNPVHITMR